MANPEHIAKFHEGQSAWLSWRHSNPSLRPDLSGADLSLAALQRFDFTGVDLAAANLSKANLRSVNLTSARLDGANLFQVHLVQASLMGASLREVDASEAELRRANLSNAYLVGATLVKADLRGAILTEADLSRANLRGSHLINASLSRAMIGTANLVDVDLRSANLQYSVLDNSNLTGAKFWETQRAGWSITGVICELAYWDRDAKIPTRYEPGEFERLFCDQTLIELFYEGGISTFELNTFPALLHHLSSKHPDVNIHLKTIEESGGGARITITLGDADDTVKAQVESEATELVRMQLKLREDEALRLQIENTTLKQLHETTIRMMLTAGAPQTHFHGPVGVAALPSGSATVQINQSVNDNTELIQLLEKLLTHKAEFTATQATEIETAKAELQKSNPDKSVLSRSLDFLKTLPKEAVIKGVGKLGERAASADWPNLLHQLGEFIHHLR